MIVYKKGDVLNSGEKYIVHGCNCKNAMGAGLGGGNWAVIEDILENVSNSFGMTFIVYEYENVGNWKW